MAKSYKEYLQDITTLIFAIDGVFTSGRVLFLPDGQTARELHTKDGFAVQLAVKKGLRVVIITGGNAMATKEALRGLGIRDIFLDCKNKLEVFNSFIEQNNLKKEEVLYMGDDIPDYQVMKKVGLATCPADAAEEIKGICHYVSNRKGGEGCVREIIEQTLKIKGSWLDGDAFEW